MHSRGARILRWLSSNQSSFVLFEYANYLSSRLSELITSRTSLEPLEILRLERAVSSSDDARRRFLASFPEKKECNYPLSEVLRHGTTSCWSIICKFAVGFPRARLVSSAQNALRRQADFMSTINQTVVLIVDRREDAITPLLNQVRSSRTNESERDADHHWFLVDLSSDDSRVDWYQE